MTQTVNQITKMDKLELELIASSGEGTLTQPRYDEILTEILPVMAFKDTALTYITFGQHEWRYKWIEYIQTLKF
jgi:hypothetical protein